VLLLLFVMQVGVVVINPGISLIIFEKMLTLPRFRKREIIRNKNIENCNDIVFSTGNVNFHYQSVSEKNIHISAGVSHIMCI